MNADLFIDVTPEGMSAALFEDKKLVELRNEKSNIQFQVGDIYLATIKKTMPGLNAAFVNVGYEKDAFLHYLDLGPQVKSLQKFLKQAQTKKGAGAFSKLKPEKDINKDGSIQEVLAPGQEILVQIAKEPISTKGPRLTSELSIAGRNMVLMPFSDKVSVSQKISSVEERIRLKKLLLSIKPKNYGIIVRTVAEGKRVAELDKELRTLVKHWEEHIEKIRDIKSPGLVVGEIGRVSAILRDILNPSFNNIVVNDQLVYREIKEYVSLIAPDRDNIVKLHKSEIPIFEQYGVDKQTKSLFGKTVSFKSGAYLIIEHTEALHVIDVNSGNRSKSANDQESNALEVNLAAADEIARQLRLRDMGGIIVVDFIDMQNNDNRQKVFDQMKEAMANDRTKHNILPLSKFGLMQITRQRVRPELTISTDEVCPTCLGTGKSVASIILPDQIFTVLKNLVEEKNIKKLTLRVHPFVYAYLNKGFFSIIGKWKRTLSRGIKVVPSASLGLLEYKIFSEDKKEVDLS
ncbi:MAG: Rne/Rng family ribonuclease [Marinilabiliaceae bacterium]|nr:Rne/Rng family ribonuclease [Marinilabiliaceae bacterium]